ncbi:MAG: hypothetical protein L0Y76_10605, partial [Ignavibacteria bacterium]|nr:hypothetical protein [Ignavibacteria bacterium]
GKNFMNMNGNMPNAPVHDIAVHQEQNELIAGTHGRSVYVTNLESLRQIAGGKLKNLQILAVKKVRHSKNWGKRTFDWRYNLPESPAVEFYSENGGPVKFTVKAEDGLILFEKQIKSVRGLNYFDYDLSVEGENAIEYSELVNIDKEAKYGKGDNGKYYLWKGKYTVEISNGSEIDESMLEISEPDER